VKRVLVAAFGNELRGDDGFGIAVLRRLEALPAPPAEDVDVRFVEVGTGGLWLAQQLLTPCDRLIIVDAVSRGGTPGTISVLRVEHVPDTRDIDLHLTVPARALAVAKALGALPPETFIVGCEPSEVDELAMSLSEAVSLSIPAAVERVRDLIEVDQ
jgi:hydrogenase maturation protease